MRPLRNGELIDRGLRVFQRHGLFIVRNSSIPAVLCVAAFALIDNYVIPNATTSRAGAHAGEQVATASYAGAIAVLVGGPLFIFGISWILGLSCQSALVALTGGEFVEDDILESARERQSALLKAMGRSFLKSALPMLISSLLLVISGFLLSDASDSALPGILATLGILGLIFGFLYWMIVRQKESLIPPVVMFEDGVNAKQASARSRTLLGSNRYHATGGDAIGNSAGLLLVIFGLFMGSIYASSKLIGLQGVIEGMLDPGPLRATINTIIDISPFYFGFLFFLPAWGTILSAIYIDRCIRLEGLDIDTLVAYLPQNSRQPHA